MFKNKYRVVIDRFLGFEVQIKRWWFPFWYPCESANTSSTLEKAKQYIEKHKNRVVYEEE